MAQDQDQDREGRLQHCNVPRLRIRAVNAAPVRRERHYVLYWMTAFRRPAWNFSLDRARAWAEDLQKPLLILEALRAGYPWAADRLHRFVLDGMTANAAYFNRTGALYYPYLEPAERAGKGLLAALGAGAAVVVTDDFPAFFIPRMTAAAGRQLDVRLEKVDANGLLPMRAADRPFPTAYAFRRFLQKTLPVHLVERPSADPLAGLPPRGLTLPRSTTERWPLTTLESLKDDRVLEALPIDHGVHPVDTPGGVEAARSSLERFLLERLQRYASERNEPEIEATSGLSPYLHFGHLSVHEVFHTLAEKEGWFFDRLGLTAKGGRQGWWGMSESAEAFLDQLVTWRELGFNGCLFMEDYDAYASLPDWARATLERHRQDPREYVYDLAAFEGAATHDPLWNAAQRQLLREGTIHNYLRMLWGKKILEWTSSPEEALRIMIELNNRYALDGRDPNSYSGIFWTLGRYDHAWGPERPVFGTVRYMSSANTARKVRVKDYLLRYAP
ncbi:DNA photolyase FAD-binding protein [uncultured Desulfatiglans sp.]|nr:DNA photolyase FAD-binding protein [uncultured Desulfatiglans sp.]